MDQSNISRTSGIKAKDKIGYLMGDFGSLCVFGLVQSVLQRYYTDILQINIVSIMTMMIVARVWDAINDPISNQEDKLITATNKWLLAHAESSEAKDGAWVGITGENIDIAADI